MSARDRRAACRRAILSSSVDSQFRRIVPARPPREGFAMRFRGSILSRRSCKTPDAGVARHSRLTGSSRGDSTVLDEVGPSDRRRVSVRGCRFRICPADDGDCVADTDGRGRRIGGRVGRPNPDRCRDRASNVETDTASCRHGDRRSANRYAHADRDRTDRRAGADGLRLWHRVGWCSGPVSPLGDPGRIGMVVGGPCTLPDRARRSPAGHVPEWQDDHRGVTCGPGSGPEVDLYGSGRRRRRPGRAKTSRKRG